MTTIEVFVDALAFGGVGVGRLPDGKALLVHGAAPQERVLVEVTEDRRSYARGVVSSVVDASPDRVAPPCSVADQCGGCGWMHVSEKGQQTWKQQLVARELERAELSDQAQTDPIVTGPSLGSRTRTRLHRRGRTVGTLAARSHRVIPLKQCPILAPQLETFALELARSLEPLPPNNLELELYVDRRQKRGLHVSAPKPLSVERWRQLARDLGLVSLVLAWPRQRVRHREGPPLEEESAGLPLAFEPGLFVQTNREINAHLVDKAQTLAGEGERFVECYAGVGNITIHLAKRFRRGVALEGQQRSARFLTENLGPAQAPSIEVRAESDSQSARRLTNHPRPDVIVMDPPRAGIKPLWPLIKRLGAPRLVMVSCHPMSAIRDVAHLSQNGGYELERLVPLDLFPHTPHLELVARMKRR
jgi:23S rRNA (uracil1939-C5)-methyltransferase